MSHSKRDALEATPKKVRWGNEHTMSLDAHRYTLTCGDVPC